MERVSLFIQSELQAHIVCTSGASTASKLGEVYVGRGHRGDGLARWRERLSVADHQQAHCEFPY
jgi:hypothetical protein